MLPSGVVSRNIDVVVVCVSVESTLELHKCPLCGKLAADVKALMVRTSPP